MPQMCPECSRDNPDGASFCAACAEPLRGLLGSQTLLENRYRVTRVLGCGGMGAVYLAEDTRIPGRQVAIKENLNRAAQAQFQAEVAVMSQLKHPGLPEIKDQFVGPHGRQYLVMDFIAGDDLEDVVSRRGPLPEPEATALAASLLDILEYLHANGIIHRDIKPGNIKLTPAGKPVLVDFGIAKQWAQGRKTQTWARGFGSPGFASPEHYGGSTDERSDLYSLGAVLYFLVTAQPPPEATALVAGAALPPPRQFQPSLSAEAQRLMFKALAVQSAHRYQSASEMRRDLLQAAPPPAPPPTIIVTPPAYSRPGLWFGLAGTAVLVLAIVFVLNASRPGEPTVTPTPIPPVAVVATTTPAATTVAAVRTPTPTATQRPTSTPTRRPTSTPTRRPTATPTRRPTSTPTRRATATPTPRPIAQAAAALTVLSGPGQNYPAVTQARAGDRLLITARNHACTWFQVTVAGGQTGWVPVSQVNANLGACDPPAVADPPIPTATTPPRPTNTPVRPTPTPRSLASNVAGFSGSQGGGGWWYQVERGRNSGFFEDFPHFGNYGSPPRNCWLTGQEEHVRICAEGEVHPGVTGRIAYRWRSDAARSVRIVVHAHKIDTSCGDGVWVGTFRVPDGRPPEKLGEFHIAGAEYRDRPRNTYPYQTSLGAGDAVMVMVDIYRTSGCDQTRLYIDIN